MYVTNSIIISLSFLYPLLMNTYRTGTVPKNETRVKKIYNKKKNLLLLKSLTFQKYVTSCVYCCFRNSNCIQHAQSIYGSKNEKPFDDGTCIQPDIYSTLPNHFFTFFKNIKKQKKRKGVEELVPRSYIE